MSDTLNIRTMADYAAAGEVPEVLFLPCWAKKKAAPAIPHVALGTNSFSKCRPCRTSPC